jgi:hypothetical protein
MAMDSSAAPSSSASLRASGADGEVCLPQQLHQHAVEAHAVAQDVRPPLPHRALQVGALLRGEAHGAPPSDSAKSSAAKPPVATPTVASAASR